MTSQHQTGSSTSQLDCYLHGIKKEFDRLNQELDEARRQRDEYKLNYRNQEKERQELIKLLFHRLNGKDQICPHCEGEITHTAGRADDNPSTSPASEYPFDKKGVVADRLDSTGDSKKITPVKEDGDVRERAISENGDPTGIRGVVSPSIQPGITSTTEVGKSRWDIKYNGDTKVALKLDLAHDLTQGGGTNVAFSPDGKYLATASNIGVVRIFDVNTGERLSVMRDLYANSDDQLCYTCLGFSPDNNYLATGERDGKVTIWIISQRRVRNIFRLQDCILDLNLSREGRHLVTCSYDGTVRIWRLRDGLSRVLTGGQYSPLAVRFSPDGRYVASGSRRNWKILIWDVRTRRLAARWEGHSNAVSSLAFTPDGKGLVTASWDQTIACWDVAWLSSLRIIMDNAKGEQDIKSTVTEISRFVGHTDYVYTVSISPDGKWITSGSDDKTVRIWNAHDAALQCTLHGLDGVWSVAFSPVGTRLAIGGFKHSQVTIWDYACTAAPPL